MRQSGGTRVLNLSQLEAFLETCSQGSYTLAAERLFISQPALHHKVKQLEAHLGVPLLVVSNRRVVPTAAGEFLQAEARGLVDKADQLERHFAGLAEKQSIRVGAVSLLAAGALSRAVEAFRHTQPGVAVVVDSIDSSEMFAALLSERIEIVVTYIDYVTGDVEFEPLRRSRLVCAASTTHPLVDGRAHHLNELLQFPIALTQKGMALRTKVENWFRDNGDVDDLPVAFEARTAAILSLGVSNTPNWITFLPENALAAFHLAEILLAEPPIYSQPVVCHLAGRPLRGIVDSFLRTLVDVAANYEDVTLAITGRPLTPDHL